MCILGRSLYSNRTCWHCRQSSTDIHRVYFSSRCTHRDCATSSLLSCHMIQHDSRPESASLKQPPNSCSYHESWYQRINANTLKVNCLPGQLAPVTFPLASPTCFSLLISSLSSSLGSLGMPSEPYSSSRKDRGIDSNPWEPGRAARQMKNLQISKNMDRDIQIHASKSRTGHCDDRNTQKQGAENKTQTRPMLVLFSIASLDPRSPHVALNFWERIFLPPWKWQELPLDPRVSLKSLWLQPSRWIASRGAIASAKSTRPDDQSVNGASAKEIYLPSKMPPPCMYNKRETRKLHLSSPCWILLQHFCQVSASPSCENYWHAPCLPIASVADQQEVSTSASHADDIPLPNLPRSSGPKPNAFPDFPGLLDKKFRVVRSTRGVQRNSQVLAPDASHKPFGSYTTYLPAIWRIAIHHLLRMFVQFWLARFSCSWNFQKLAQFSFISHVQNTHLVEFNSSD